MMIRGNQMMIMVVLLLFMIIFLLIKSVNYTYGVPQLTQSLFSTVNELKDNQLPTIYPYACPRNQVPDLKMDFVICVKRPDEYISKQIIEAGNWDMAASLMVMSLVNNYPEGTFLDIGSNIGPFSVMVASTKYSVVSVDPFAGNLAYIRASARLGGYDKEIRVIQNTVSSEKMTLIPWTQDPNNEGYVVFLSQEEAATKPAYQLGEGVNSVKFEDVLRVIPTETVILKIDVEGAECKVLSEYMNSSTKLKFIPYIYMEWSHVRTNNFGLCPHIDQLLQGFKYSGYKPYPNLKGEPLSPEKYMDWYDVLWVHKDALL